MRGDAIGLVSEQILLFHTTPTPTGCLLPCYWALQGLDGPGRSLCWTNPGSVNWRAARAGPILGAFIYRLVKARPIVWEFIGNCLDWSGGLDEGRTTSKNLFRRLINGWILPEIFYMKFFKQTVLGGVKYVLKCWSDCKMVQSNLAFLTTFWLWVLWTPERIQFQELDQIPTVILSLWHSEQWWDLINVASVPIFLITVQK